MSDPSYKKLPQEFRPKDTPGVDWGAKAWILVRKGDRGPRLLWQTGHTGWASILEPKHYYPATLELEHRPLAVGDSERLSEGGRLSIGLIRTHVDKVAQWLDVDRGWLLNRLVETIRDKETLVIEE